MKGPPGNARCFSHRRAAPMPTMRAGMSAAAGPLVYSASHPPLIAPIWSDANSRYASTEDHLMKVRLMFVSALTTVLWACSGDPVAPPRRA